MSSNYSPRFVKIASKLKEEIHFFENDDTHTDRHTNHRSEVTGSAPLLPTVGGAKNLQLNKYVIGGIRSTIET